MTAGGVTLKKGDVITIDGAAGQVMQGAVPMVKPELTGDFATLMGWADEVRRMKVRANAETPTDARVARSFGAEGIGLCRTEHMFFEGERIVAVREMILAETEEGRRAALAKLLPMQRQDFADLFEIMTGLPVTIRLLDPPLHEFLPKTDEEIDEVSKAMGVNAEKLRRRVGRAARVQPDARLPRRAACGPLSRDRRDAGARHLRGRGRSRPQDRKPITAEIMLPRHLRKPEFDLVKAIIVATAEAVAKETGVTVPYHVGTMIELPRAALQAGEIAESAEFFSFGTNDLTQTTLGISRDDAGSFLGVYTAKGLLPADPFVTLDTVGVGELVKIAAERGTRGPPEPQGRHLRRARRRPGLDRLLRDGASRLRVVLAVPRPDRPSRRGAGGARTEGAFDGLTPDGVRGPGTLRGARRRAPHRLMMSPQSARRQATSRTATDSADRRDRRNLAAWDTFDKLRTCCPANRSARSDKSHAERGLGLDGTEKRCLRSWPRSSARPGVAVRSAEPRIQSAHRAGRRQRDLSGPGAGDDRQ